MPISSSSTSDRGVRIPNIDFRFSMCAENVERSAAMDCSSPISASTRSKIPSRAACAATGIPDCAASTASPTVFNATVLPPVFGPLMTSTVSSLPNDKLSGTTGRPCGRSVLSSAGCRAASSAITISSVNSGMQASYSRANRPRAKNASNSAIVPAPWASAPRSATSLAVSSSRIRAISAASSSRSWTKRLLISIVSSGSTKTVCPVALAAWTTPSRVRRSDARTGIT